jgi:hypothetical protein
MTRCPAGGQPTLSSKRPSPTVLAALTVRSTSTTWPMAGRQAATQRAGYRLRPGGPVGGVEMGGQGLDPESW